MCGEGKESNTFCVKCLDLVLRHPTRLKQAHHAKLRSIVFKQTQWSDWSATLESVTGNIEEMWTGRMAYDDVFPPVKTIQISE